MEEGKANETTLTGKGMQKTLRGVLEPDFDGPVKGAGQEDVRLVIIPGQATHHRGVCWVVVQGVACTHNGTLEHCPRVEAQQHYSLPIRPHCQACNHTLGIDKISECVRHVMSNKSNLYKTSCSFYVLHVELHENFPYL